MPDFEPFERVLLTIEYDGSAFYGWQRQARLRSVQEELERALDLLRIAIDRYNKR